MLLDLDLVLLHCSGLLVVVAQLLVLLRVLVAEVETCRVGLVVVLAEVLVQHLECQTPEAVVAVVPRMVVLVDPASS